MKKPVAHESLRISHHELYVWLLYPQILSALNGCEERENFPLKKVNSHYRLLLSFATHRSLLFACAFVTAGDAAGHMSLQVHQTGILWAALDVRTGDAVRCKGKFLRVIHLKQLQSGFCFYIYFLKFLHFLRFYVWQFRFNGPLAHILAKKIMWTSAGVISRFLDRLQLARPRNFNACF